MNHLSKKRIRLLPLLVTAILASAAYAAGPNDLVPAVPAGYARYVVVLWEPGTPLPGGGYMGRMPELNFAALGGFVRGTNANERLIDLPPAQATQVRQDPSVAYVQRLWMGEPMDELYEQPSSPAKRRKIGTEDDPSLTWGPKEYSYDGSGNITRIGTAGAYDNYTYDTAGRLIQATVGGKTESYQYDSFGNLVSKGVAGTNATAIPVDSSSNRQLGVVYDAAGNMTARGDREVYQYDPFNMMTSTSRPGMNPRRVLYDANDERVAVISGGAISRWWFRDFEGHVLREYRGEEAWPTFWLWEEDYVYAEGQLVAGATIDWTVTDQNGQQSVYGGARHYHLDHLGSVRMVTNPAGRSVSEHDYFPFGVTPTKAYQEEIDWGDPQIDTMRYAGHQRDFLGFIGTESTDYLDYMHARYYDPNLGRFLSVDPVAIVDTAVHRPQTWNRYSYVANNPINLVDPTGAVLISLTGQNTLLDIAGQATANITFGPDGTIDTKKLTQQDLTGNEGALLLQQMAMSTNVYTYEEGNTAMSAGGTQNVSGVSNLDDNPTDIILPSGNALPKGHGRFPVAGVNGAVTVDPAVQYLDAATGTKKVPIRAIAFHELAESYAKVENNIVRGPNNGPGAHLVSRLREVILMMQRPAWTPYPAGGDLKR